MFNVGHGDSLVLEINIGRNKYWGMIDSCVLIDSKTKTKVNPALKFFKAHEEITHLSFLCMTHPHSDHYLGMSSIIEYFSQEGRSIGEFWDFGLDSLKSLAFAKDGDNFNELDTIFDLILRNCKKRTGRKKFIYRALSNNYLCWSAKQVKIVCLSPFGEDIINVSKSISNYFKNDSLEYSISGLANNLSIVLLISIKDKNILLCGDAEKRLLEKIIHNWDDISKKHKVTKNLTIIKIPHHGSKLSYSDYFYSFFDYEKPIALISGGIKPGLPSKSVLDTLFIKKFEVYCTNLGRACKYIPGPISEKFLHPKTSFALDSIMEPFEYNLNPGFGNCATNLDSKGSVAFYSQYLVNCIYRSGQTCQYT